MGEEKIKTLELNICAQFSVYLKEKANVFWFGLMHKKIWGQIYL